MMTLALLALAAPTLSQRWFYLQTNLLVDANAQQAVSLLERASKAGYNGVVLTDTKLQSFADPPEAYRKNVRLVNERAAQLRIDVIPAVLPVGYAEGMLAHNPNLVEAMPAVHKVVVKDGEAVLIQNLDTVYHNGGFEEFTGNTFTGFAFQDGAGKATFVDTETVHSGKASLRMEDPGQLKEIAGNCRLMKRVPVDPGRHYALHAWVKTKDLEHVHNVRLMALNPNGKPLSFQNLPIQPTMDWTRVTVTFNSQTNKSVLLYLGIWSGGKGKIWWDDVEFEELGLMNRVQRPGCPTIANKDLKEGGLSIDHGLSPFLPLVDPRSGNIPWPGSFERFYLSPSLRVRPDAGLKEGDSLTVSFYHAAMTDDGKTAICLSEPETKEIERKEIERVRGLFKPKGFFLSHDEIRVMNWCQACQARKLTPAQILSQDVQGAIQMIGDTPAYIWSDMFDPYHNAVDDYYLVNGSLKGAYEGLPKTLTIVNWNQGNKDSLKFFDGRGHRQILAGFYDGEADSIRAWLDQAKGLKVTGVMYTTWVNDYSKLEAFAKAAWGRGRGG